MNPNTFAKHDISFDAVPGCVPVGWHPPTRLGGTGHMARTLDPFHEIFRRSGQVPSGVDYAAACAAVAVNGGRLPAAYDPDRVHTVRKLLASRYRVPVLNLLGVLLCWGAVTNNQAAAFTGEPALADPRSKLVASLFVAGLIRIESPYLGHGLADAGSAAVLYQPGHRHVIANLRKMLSHAEWVAVTGCHRLPEGGKHLRHDVLAAELGLRAAELLPVGTVIGPHLSRFAQLAPPRPGWRPPRGGPDLVLVREDGLRIAVEVTATLGAAFEEKVARWARVLQRAPLARSGLVVVFVVAGRAEGKTKKASRWPENKTRSTVVKAIAEVGPTNVAERMFVAHWLDWFPAPLTASPDFLDLTAATPIRRGRDPKPEWMPVSLGDQDLFAFTPAEDVDVLSITPAARMLGQTPQQPRCAGDGLQPHRLAWRVLHREAGWPLVLPTLRAGAEGRIIAAPQGSAGHARLPERLLGTTHSTLPLLIPAHGPARRLEPTGTDEVRGGAHHGAETPTGSGRDDDLARVRAALRAARRLRAEHLMAVEERLLELTDVMEAATVPGNQALRKLELKQLCLSSGMSDARWRQVRDLTLAVLGEKVAEPKLTIGWLHDPRAGGRRHYAFADALRDRDQPPWPGFPWQATTT